MAASCSFASQQGSTGIRPKTRETQQKATNILRRHEIEDSADVHPVLTSKLARHRFNLASRCQQRSSNPIDAPAYIQRICTSWMSFTIRLLIFACVDWYSQSRLGTYSARWRQVLHVDEGQGEAGLRAKVAVQRDILLIWTQYD